MSRIPLRVAGRHEKRRQYAQKIRKNVPACGEKVAGIAGRTDKEADDAPASDRRIQNGLNVSHQGLVRLTFLVLSALGIPRRATPTGNSPRKPPYPGFHDGRFPYTH